MKMIRSNYLKRLYIELFLGLMLIGSVCLSGCQSMPENMFTGPAFTNPNYAQPFSNNSVFSNNNSTENPTHGINQSWSHSNTDVNVSGNTITKTTTSTSGSVNIDTDSAISQGISLVSNILSSGNSSISEPMYN